MVYRGRTVGAVQAHCDDIEPGGHLVESMGLEIFLGNPRNLPLFAYVDRLEPGPELAGMPGLDLDKDQCVSVLGNDIDLAVRFPVVCPDDAIALSNQKLKGQGFAQTTGLGGCAASLHRHKIFRTLKQDSQSAHDPSPQRLLVGWRTERRGKDIFGHAPEGSTVQRARSVHPDGISVFTGGVSLMAMESILRIAAMGLCHQSIPGDLGDNRCSGYGGALGFSLDQGSLLHRRGNLKRAVDQEVIGLDVPFVPGAGMHGSLHGQKRCLEDVQLFDFPWVGQTDADPRPVAVKEDEELLALSSRQFF